MKTTGQITPRAAIAALWLAAVTLAGPTTAQDASDDWEMTTDPTQRLAMATLDFGDNVIALRCKAGALDMVLTGTPATSAASRNVQLTAGAIAGERQVWLTQPGQLFLSPPEPDRLARQLRAGGELDVRLEAAADVGEPARRYRLPVPVSVASVDHVLTACGRPLVEPRDLVARIDRNELTWTIAPTVDFPPVAASRDIRDGAVRLNCIIALAGRLSDCRVESEQPAGAGFAESALLGIRTGEMNIAPGQIGRVVRPTLRFRLDPSGSPAE